MHFYVKFSRHTIPWAGKRREEPKTVKPEESTRSQLCCKAVDKIIIGNIKILYRKVFFSLKTAQLTF